MKTRDIGFNLSSSSVGDAFERASDAPAPGNDEWKAIK
jgi:hypothetical protein